MRTDSKIVAACRESVIPLALAIYVLAIPCLAIAQNSNIFPDASNHASAESGQEGVPRFNHVFLIIGENTTYDHLNATNAPYLVSSVKPNAAWLTNYYAATHWSQANYVALISGQYTACEQKDGGVSCHQNVENLFHQLDTAKLSWKTWLEGGTPKCDGGGTCNSTGACPLSGFYTTGNPAILFDDVEGPNGVWSASNRSKECLENDVPAGNENDPMGFFNRALAAGEIANFNFIIPNGCEDGEANCDPIHDRFTQFDAFLEREVPLIENSPAFGPNDVIIITYDEDQRSGGLAQKNGYGEGGHVVCAILGPPVKLGEYDDRFYHYSLLRTIEDGFGLSTYVGHANDVAPITDIWF